MGDDTALILSVAMGDENRRLMTRFLRSIGYTVETASSLGEMKQLLEDADTVSVVVFDVDGFGAGVWDRLTQLRTLRVPLLVIGRRLPSATRSRVKSSGAQATLEKPTTKAELEGAVRSLELVGARA